MGVTQVVTCDCCGAALADTSVLNCAILTALVESGEVAQYHYGRACGCSAGILSVPFNHSDHKVEEVQE